MVGHPDDLELYHEIRGSGKPIYLLHGLALDHSIWTEVADYYEDQAQFILPDLRGHGRTPLGNANGTLEQFAADVIHLADRLGHQQFTLVGHSMGGYIALALAEAYPERLAGLVFVTSNARADSPEKRESRLHDARNALVEGTQSMAEALIQRMMPEGELSQPDENICEVVLNTSAEGFANVQTAIANRPNRLAVVQCLTCPVLAIAGSKDQILPVDVALEPARKAQHGRTVSLPGVGHLPMVEVPFTLGALLVSM